MTQDQNSKITRKMPRITLILIISSHFLINKNIEIFCVNQLLQHFKFMQIQSEKTCDQSKQSSAEGIQNLKKRITYSNAQLHQLISNHDQLTNRIKELNRKAAKQNADQMYQQAIVYLTEAQRNLQYAANCGLSIDRVLITTTLKNQACLYQRLWELGTCYDYMQALISNMKIYNENAYDLFENEANKDKQSQQKQKMNKILNQTLSLALSHLQFSALSSQLGKHQQAHAAVEKSLQQFRQLSKYCHSYEKASKGKTSLLLDELLANILVNPKIKIQKCLKETKNAIQKITKHIHFFTFDQKLIERLSMGDIMQISFSSVEEASKTMETEWFTSQLGLTYITIYVSCCYFALATQMRLGVQQVKGLEQENRSKIDKAKFYHLHSIKMASELVLIQSSFLQHIMRSFKNNFNIDIQNDRIEQIEVMSQLSEIKVVESAQKMKISIKVQQEHKIQSSRKKSNDITKANSPSQFLECNNQKNMGKEKANEIYQKMLGGSKTKLFKHSPTKNQQNGRKSIQKIRKENNRSKSKNNDVKFQPLNKLGIAQQVHKNKINNEYYSNIEIKNKNPNKLKKNLDIDASSKNKTKRLGSSSRSKVKLKLKNFKSPARS